MTLEELVKNAYENSKAHGFHDKMPGDDSPGGKGVTTNDLFVRVATLPEKLALIHSEVSEVLEEYREKGGNCLRIEFDAKGKPVGLWSELADVVIRVGDLRGPSGPTTRAPAGGRSTSTRSAPCLAARSRWCSVMSWTGCQRRRPGTTSGSVQTTAGCLSTTRPSRWPELDGGALRR